MSQVDSQIPLSGLIPRFQPPGETMALQTIALRAREERERQDMDNYMRQLNARGAEIRDPQTGVYTPKGILEIAQKYPDLADKASANRSMFLQHSAAQKKAERETALKEYKVQGGAVSSALERAYAAYRGATGSEEQKRIAATKEWQAAWDEAKGDGTAASFGFTPERLEQLRSQIPNPDTIPGRILKVKDMIERADSADVAGSMGADNKGAEKPGVPLSDVGKISTDAVSGAETKIPNLATPQGKPIAENEAATIEVTAKAPPENPESMRAQANKLDKLGTPTAQKKAKDLRSAANQLEQRIQADERIEAAKQREKRMADVASGGEIRDEDARFVAQQVLAGNQTAGIGLARNIKAKAKVMRAITDEAARQGMTAKDAAMAVAEFQGMVQGERTVGTRQAQIEMAGNVVAQFVPLAKQRSDEYKRFGIKSLNDLQKAVLSRTASPELRRVAAATNAVINAYARAVNPTGVGNEADKEHAREILDIGFASGDFNAAADQIMLEIKAELKAPGAVKGGMREFFKGEKESPDKPSKDFSGIWK